MDNKSQKNKESPLFSALVRQGLVGFTTPFTSPGSVTEKQDVTPWIEKIAPNFSKKLGYDGKPNYRTVTRMRAPVYLEDPIAAAAQLYNFGAGYLADKGVNINGYFPAQIKTKTTDRFIDDVAKARERSQEYWGVQDPSNAAEVAAETFGSMLVPGMQVKVASKLIKPVEKSMTLAQKTGRVAANTGRVAAQAAVEIAGPGNNSGLKAIPIATGLSVGANELVDHALSNSNDAEVREIAKDYTSIQDVSRWVLQPEKRQKEWSQYLSPEIIEEYNKAVDEGDIAYTDSVQALGMQLKEKDNAESYLPPEPDWVKFGVDTAMAGILAGSIWMGGRLKSGLSQRLANGTELAGKEFESSNSSVGTKAGQALFQNDQAVRDSTKQMTGDSGFIGESRGLRQWKAKFDGISIPALQSKINNFMATGQLPQSGLKTDPISHTLEQVAALDPASRSMLTDGLLAKSALNDWKRTGKATSFKTKQDGTPYTINELQDLVNLGEQGPLKDLANRIRQHYRDQLDYMLEQRFINKTQYDQYILDRKDYVHFSKNTEGDFLDELLSRDVNSRPTDTIIQNRSDASGGGISAGNAADPVLDLSNRWAEIIHNVQINSVKRDWLDLATTNSELSKIITQVPINKGGENIHTIKIDGKEVHYKVKDQMLSEALDFSPFTTRSVWAQVLDTPRKLFQAGTTGVGNPLFAGTAMVYDTVTGIALRPKNFQLGVINEFLNKVSKGKHNLGMFDPTAWVTAPIGAVRHAADSIVEAFSHEMAYQLQNGSGLFIDLMGPNKTKQLQTVLSSAYNKSYKSIMEEYGAGGSSPFLASAPDTLSPGMQGISPRFASEAAKSAFVSAIRGDASPAKIVLQGSKSAWEIAKASPIARMYAGLMKSMHEGFRYQAFATNYAKGALTQDDMVLLSSQVRRLAGDIGQQGGAKLIQDLNHSAVYANIALQTTAELGRKLKNQPITTIANIMGTITMLAAFRYGKLAIDPEYREELRNRSDSQTAASFKTFGDLAVNIPPELRVISAPIFAALDHAMGLHDINEDGSDNFKVDVLKGIEAWIDGSAQTEDAKASVSENMKASLGSVMPYSLSSFPLINAGASAIGFDLGFSKFTGQPETIREQTKSPLYGEGTLTNDAMKATWQNVITNIIGSGTFAAVRASLDYNRAIKDNGKAENALRIALSRLTDQQASQNGPFQGVFYRNYEKMQGVN
ncbi:MAG: hypothetical protein IM525_03075, partial [Microcystis sp. M43BS1]